MDHEVTDGTDASLPNQSPQHVGTVVAVSWLVKRLLGKEVTMTMLVILRRDAAPLTRRTACLFTPS